MLAVRSDQCSRQAPGVSVMLSSVTVQAGVACGWSGGPAWPHTNSTERVLHRRKDVLLAEKRKGYEADRAAMSFRDA